jgi:hypothetical protein
MQNDLNKRTRKTGIKRILVFLIFCLSYIFASAQENTIQLSLDFELNSKREIVTATNSKVYLDGELVSDDLISLIYKVALIDTTYRPTFSFEKQFSESLSQVDLNQADQDGLIELFVKITEERLKSLTYHIIFDEKTREAVEIINDSIFDQYIKKAIKTTKAQFSDFMADDDEGKKEFSKNLENYLTKSKKSILDELLTDFNDLMSPYAYQFPSEGKIKDSVVVNDISFFSQVANNGVKAELTISSELDKNTVIVNSSLDYDKASFIEVAKQANAAFHELEAKDINIIERNNFESDLISKWLKKYSSERIISIPGIKVIYVNTYTFYE